MSRADDRRRAQAEWTEDARQAMAARPNEPARLDDPAVCPWSRFGVHRYWQPTEAATQRCEFCGQAKP